MQYLKFNSIMFLIFSKNEMLEIFERETFKFFNCSQLDIGEKSLIKLQCSKFNSLIFLFFSKNEISEIFVLLTSKSFNFSQKA